MYLFRSATRMESCLGCPIVNDPSCGTSNETGRPRRARWISVVFASAVVLTVAVFILRNSFWDWWTGGLEGEEPFASGALDDYVPEDSEALLVADLHALLQSSVGRQRLKPILQRLLRQSDALPRWMEMLEVNPENDLDLVRISFAPGSGAAPLWLMRGRFDCSRAHIGPEKLRERRLGRYRLWEYTESAAKRTVLIALAGDTLIAGETQERVREALEQARDPHSISVRDATLGKLLTKVDRRQPLWLAASMKSLGSIANIDNYLLRMVVNPLLQNADSLYGGVKVADDLRLELTIGTTTAEQADRLQIELRSLREAAPGAALLLGDQKELTPVLRLLGTSKVSREGKILRLHSRLSADQWSE